MDTKEMLGIVDMLADLKPFFRGIFATNSLPVRVTRFPSAVVCNTDPIEEICSHWIAFLAQKRNRMRILRQLWKITGIL